MTTASTPAEAPYDLRHGLGCALTSLLAGLSQGLGLQLVSANLGDVQGSLGASAAEAAWLTTAYFAAFIPGVLLLTKVRTQFGLGMFNVAVPLVLAAGVLHLLTQTVGSAIAVRAALGFAAAPLSTMAILYMGEAFPRRLITVGVVLGFGTLQLGTPIARIVAPDLLQYGQWHGLFLLDVALALLTLAAVNAVKLAPTPTQNAFSRGDLISFPLFTAGVALLCVVLTQGRLHWWRDAEWLGYCLAGAVACLGLATLIDLNRAHPMLDVRFLGRPFVLRFTAAILLFRVALSEQTTGITGLMNVLGMRNEQMADLFALILAGTVAGFFVALAAAKLARPQIVAMLAAGLIAVGAWLDSSATSLTRPAELYFSQTLLALALATFFASSVMIGFGRVIAEGSKDLITFIAVFASSQYIGTLIGTAWITTFVADQQARHFAALAQHLSLADPQVATRVLQLGGSLGGVVTDRAQRAAEGVALLAQQAAREAWVLAYNDVFQWIAALAVGILLWMTLLAVRASHAPAAAPAPA